MIQMKEHQIVPYNSFNLAKRLGAYSAVAAATASVADIAGAAEVIWDIPDIAVGDDPGLLFNMVTGETASAASDNGNATPGSMRLIGNYAALASYPGAYIYTPASSTFGAFVGVGSDATLLAAGAQIGENQTFGRNADSSSLGNYANLNNWNLEGTRGFVGIRFKLDNATHYGWADITYNDALNTATLHAFGYNDTPEAASAPPTDSAPAPLTITKFEHDTDANTVTLTWRKTTATTYIVKYSTDMSDWSQDLDDGITAADDENPEDTDHITVTFTLFETLTEEPDLFFRIEEEI